MIGRAFVVQPDLFLVNPANRAFVEGDAERPHFWPLWLAVLADLPISIGLLGLGAGVLPIALPEAIAGWQPLLLVLGLIGLGGSIFIILLIRRLGQGQLVEGRVVEAALLALSGASRSQRKYQRIIVELRTPDGQILRTLVRRADTPPKALPR